jgi:hypothetical protein
MVHAYYVRTTANIAKIIRAVLPAFPIISIITELAKNAKKNASAAQVLGNACNATIITYFQMASAHNRAVRLEWSAITWLKVVLAPKENQAA